MLAALMLPYMIKRLKLVLEYAALESLANLTRQEENTSRKEDKQERHGSD
jgi:hypothetical protein